MNEKIKLYQSRLFNKLFLTLPNIRKIETTENSLNLIEDINHIYYFQNKSFWFTNGETKEKYVFIFGKCETTLKNMTIDDSCLTIDFDKNMQFNESSLGMFSIENSEIHIILNKNLLSKKYPYINTSEFKNSIFKSIDNKLKLDVVDLGALEGDFIENIEKLVDNTSKITKNKNMDNLNKSTIQDSNLCNICSKDKKKIKIHSDISNLKNIRPELCGECIEKIFVSEFYKKIIPLIYSNETKSLNVVKEKFADDALFDLGMKLLEKYDIINYIGVKKLYFNLDNNSKLVSDFIKYSNDDNLLIDNVITVTTKNKPKKSKILNLENTNLTKIDKKKMELFIDSLENGKTHEEALIKARINPEKIEKWYENGKNGQQDYIPFYDAYSPYHPINKRKSKIDEFLEELKKEKNLDNALKNTDLEFDKVISWYNLGKKGEEEYKDFYFACNLILPNGIQKTESKKIVNNDELMKEFIALIEDGKTNAQAIEHLKIPKFKVKNWCNQGKLGNKKYVDFYNAYMLEINRKELKKAKKLEKKLNKKNETKPPQNIIENEKSIDNNSKRCKLCGRTLSEHTQKDICKRCARKRYASKIILKLTKSIEPGIKFKKEDLKLLGLKTFQIQDYIWTLQEFNLITEENNKFRLKDKETLEKFIEKSGIEIENIQIEKNNIKLNKTCEKCGETLEISKFAYSDNSPDGYDATCKDCRKLIATAGYLKEIIEYVDYDSKFTEDSLKPYFKDSFLLRGKLWSLLDNDLVKRNFEEDAYQLSDEKTVKEFLDKYYEEKSEVGTVKEKTIKTTRPKDPKEYTKQDQMEVVIEEIKNGKSRKEAAETAQIPLYKITHWYTEGRQGYGKDNVNFYKQMNEIEKINNEKNNELKNRMNLVLKELENGQELSKLRNSNENEIKEWWTKGEKNIEPYSYFYEKYGNIILKNRKNKIILYNQKEINRKIFFENFRNGKTKEESAENSQLELSLINEWYFKGQHDEEPYNEFYKEYIKTEKSNQKPEFPQIKKTDKFGTSLSITQMNLILKNLVNGMDEKEAVENANISFNTYKYWINRGKQKFGEIYTQFYQYVTEIKNGKYEILNEHSKNEETSIQNNNLEKILIPLPKEYEDSFKSSKMNRTGIAWVNIIGKQWIYQKTVNNRLIKIGNSNIYKLYDEVKENNLPWGIRDFDLAKKVILGNEELTESIKYPPKSEKINEIDPDIYAPLPEEYEESFKSNPSNQTGIAWVNAPGNGTKWIYEKRIDGKTIKIIDDNIYELHKKVKEQNHVWGIRDYSKAKQIIDIPNDFEIPTKLEKDDNSNFIPSYINPEIYAPLPKKYKNNTYISQSNKTGIAWVNKTGRYWKYSRKVNNIQITIIDKNIYELFEKVKKENLEWGIKDYTKAKKIIKIPEDYVPPKEIIESHEEVTSNILTPLPEKYRNSFSQPNNTGIAWVNKNGNNWIYQRKVNGIPIKFSNPDIYKLHEIVIKNHHVWGIVDIDKAKKIICPNKEISKPEIKSIDFTSQNISVINVGKNEKNNTNYIIKGIIRNNELLKLLNNLNLFEQDFKRIITNSVDGKLDLFIELEIKENLSYAFEEKIKELNWKIIK